MLLFHESDKSRCAPVLGRISQSPAHTYSHIKFVASIAYYLTAMAALNALAPKSVVKKIATTPLESHYYRSVLPLPLCGSLPLRYAGRYRYLKPCH